MANTLTGLIPTIYEALDIVLREPAGMIPAVMMDANGEQAALDQTISWPVVPVQTAASITPAATGPSPDAQTILPLTMSISNSKSVTFAWNGEEQKSLGGLYNKILMDQFAQAMRTLVNEVEEDLAGLYKYASRAYGSSGVTPFSSTLSELAQVRKILADNGAPMGDLQCVINTTAGANLRTLTQLTKVNEAGDDSLVRRGMLLDIHGFKIRESGQIQIHTKGTGTGFKVDLTAGYAKGITAIHIDTGIGTLLTGDVIQNIETGRDSEKYVVKTGGTGATGDTDIDMVLSNPGLISAWNNDDDFTIQNSYAANMAFARSAIALVARVPAMPEGGDAADDMTIITDPNTGLSFLVAMYRQYHQVAFEVGLAWGVKAVKPEAMALLLG